MPQILSYKYEGKDWPLLPPGPKGRMVSCPWCDNILNDRRAYCTFCGKSASHWGPYESDDQPCHLCGSRSVMLCVQCNRPVCKACSQFSKSGCITVSEKGYIDNTRLMLLGPKEILTCRDCVADMMTLQTQYESIFNVNGDYRYIDLEECLWHKKKTAAKCIICNKPLCEICAYFKEKSILGLNRRMVGPFCHEHLQEPKKWAILAQMKE